MSVSQRVGARVADARKAAGLTQKALSEVLGLTRTSVANIEAGRQALSIEYAALAARVLRVDVGSFIQPGDLPPAPPSPHHVTIRCVYEVTCETCGGTVLDAPTGRPTAEETKRDHIAAMKRNEATS